MFRAFDFHQSYVTLVLLALGEIVSETMLG